MSLVGASGFEPPTSWSRTRNQINLSRCPGVSYGFSGRSLLDKFGQVSKPYGRTIPPGTFLPALEPHQVQRYFWCVLGNAGHLGDSEPASKNKPLPCQKPGRRRTDTQGKAAICIEGRGLAANFGPVCCMALHGEAGACTCHGQGAYATNYVTVLCLLQGTRCVGSPFRHDSDVTSRCERGHV